MEMEREVGKKLEAAAEQKAALECLLTGGSLPYLKSMALAIQKEYECGPPKTAEEKVKWESFMAMTWAFNRLFTQVESIAKNPLPTIEEVLEVLKGSKRP